MSTNQKDSHPLLHQVAPDPLQQGTEAWTAENLLRFTATRGMLASGTYPFRTSMPEPDDQIGRLQWLVNFLDFTGHFNLYLLLNELRQVAPDRADKVARLILSAYDSGDSYGEWLWQWTEDHGIDPKALVEEHESADTARKDQPA